MHRLLLILLLATLTAFGALGASGWHWLQTPLHAAPGTVLIVAPGTSLRSLAFQMEADGLLKRPRWLVWLARWQGDATRIQAGEYALESSLTPKALLALLVRGDVVLHQVTLVEGWTVSQAVAAVRDHPRVQATEATASPRALAAAIGLASTCPEDDCPWSRLEGALFPDTYRFADGSEDIVLLRQAHERLDEELAAAWAGRETQLPLTSQEELLVLASIVEKETALASERPRIAGVFVRRLQQGMRLQSDPTVIYGVGDAYAGDITRKHLRTDTPYNTYTRGGLPPTPIALAGRAALEAAAHPAAGEALYFVATGDGDGSHQFSATLEEHNAAVRRYLAKQRQQQAVTP
ncbi:MAG: endolytic transglycosylase MltG [Pseudomonadota bacterium]